MLHRAGIGDGIWDAAAIFRLRKHRRKERRIGIDIGCQHGDVTRLQRRVEASIVQQRTQTVVQHLHFSQTGMAGVKLQAVVVWIQRITKHVF